MPRAKLSDAPTWHKQSNAWRKRATIAGAGVVRRYKYENNAKGRKQAHDDWLADLAELKAAAEPKPPVRITDKITPAELANAEYEYASDSGVILKDAEGNRTVYHGDRSEFVRRESLARDVSRVTESANAKTWSQLADLFEQDERRRMEKGEIKPVTFNKGSQRIAKIVRRQFGETPVQQTEQALGSFLMDWRRRREQDAANGDCSPTTVGSEAGLLGKFLRASHKQYLIDCPLPRNLEDIVRQGDYETNATAVKPKTLSKIYAAAPERTRLFILLALNCGFKGSDIGRVTVGEYDSKRGVIDYTRRKTAKKANKGKGVRVRYKLWAETKKLLDAYANKGKKTEPLILSETGGELWYISNAEAGSVLDYPAQEYKRLCNRIKVKETTFTDLRKTGATWFKENAAAWRATYLSHTDRSMGERYTDYNAIDLDKALKDFHLALDKFGKTLNPSLK